MDTTITQAMLLSAGFGTRMRPLTDDLPKPLLHVNGRSMLDRALDRLVEAGVKRAAINTHYLGWKIHEAMVDRTDIEITFFDEMEILDTGGGVKNALPFFGDEPFYCINTDLVWKDGPGKSTLARMNEAWDDAAMDTLMLMVKVDEVVGFGAPGTFKGDFDLEPPHVTVGRLVNPGWVKNDVKPMRDYVWVAAQIFHPRAFASITETSFSNRLPWEKALETGRLWGIVHDGLGFHAGTPEDLATVDKLIADLEK